MSTVRLDIEYDGTGFSGWAVQPGRRTVQGELEAALATVLREPVRLTAAGRTDAGVHALGQVASFETTAEVSGGLARRLNGVGPPDVAVTAANSTADGFDARRDARSRTYRYRLLTRSASSPFARNRALWWPHRIDREALDACAGTLLGIHDFTAFTPTQTTHVRFERNILQAEWCRRDHSVHISDVLVPSASEVLEFRITADAFMHNMVRILMGTMLEVASSRRTVENFTQLLQGAPRTSAGDTAPAHGLYLESVSYAQETAAG